MISSMQTAIAPLNDRSRAMAVLHFQPVDRLPVVHFGFSDV